MALEYASESAAFRSLLPWMKQVGCFEVDELRATLEANDAALSAVQGHELTLALQLSDRLLRQFFNESPIGVAVFDAAGWLVHVNAAFGALLGYRVTELLKRNIDELVHPCDVPALQERRRMLSEGRGDEFRIETRFGTANRREVWTRMWGRLERHPGGPRPHVFAHIVDFTDVKTMGCIEADWMSWEPDRYMD